MKDVNPSKSSFRLSQLKQVSLVHDSTTPFGHPTHEQSATFGLDLVSFRYFIWRGMNQQKVVMIVVVDDIDRGIFKQLRLLKKGCLWSLLLILAAGETIFCLPGRAVNVMPAEATSQEMDIISCDSTCNYSSRVLSCHFQIRMMINNVMHPGMHALFPDISLI